MRVVYQIVEIKEMSVEDRWDLMDHTIQVEITHDDVEYDTYPEAEEHVRKIFDQLDVELSNRNPTLGIKKLFKR